MYIRTEICASTVNQRLKPHISLFNTTTCMASTSIKEKRKEKKKKSEKGKEKERGKFRSNSIVEDSEDEIEPGEGNAYQPPNGAVLLKTYIDTDDFDYDTLKDNDDLELWVIRVPEGVSAPAFSLQFMLIMLYLQVKAKHFENVHVSLPTSLRSEMIGTVSRKTADYDIWSVRDEGADQTTRVGGDEVLGLNCLVPRKRKGSQLFSGKLPLEFEAYVRTQA